MRDFAYYNGALTPYDAATIPLSDRSIFFADAVYDVIIGRNGIPYQIDEHFSRLMRNADSIGLEGAPSKQELTEATELLISESNADSFILYVQISAKQKRRYHARDEYGTNLLMTVTPAQIPDELYYTSAITLPDQRHSYCNLKTINLLPSVFSIMDAEAMECDTAIFTKGSEVTEASAANVSVIIGNTLLTHPRDRSVLPGISEINLISAAKKLGLTHIESIFTADDMMIADAVLLTSTTKLVRICRSIDGKPLECRGYELANALFKEMLTDLLLKTT